MSSSGLLNFTSPYAKRLAIDSRPAVAIEIDGHEGFPTYTTNDSLSGRVVIAVPRKMSFDAVQITLEGSTRTVIDKMSPGAVDSRTVAFHNFLKLVMPISESQYATPRMFEPGQLYTFPFHFVIPERLLLSSCNHACFGDQVRHEHLAVPPSMGTKLDTLDDLAPEMAKITYAIKSKVITKSRTGGKSAVLGEGAKTIKVIPVSHEAPPMNVELDDKEYCFSRTKTLKRGIFKGKLGTITVVGAQPQPFVLPSPAATHPASSVTTVDVVFHPTAPNAKPPRLGTLSNKLRALTFYSAKPTQHLPQRRNSMDYELLSGTYTYSVPLSSRCVESVEWEQHIESPQYMRRDSGYSTLSENETGSSLVVPSKDPNPRIYYKATILVPLHLPQSRTWLPTFHSCLTSRIYTLDMSLSLHTPGAGPSTSLMLRLPIQVASAGRTAEEQQILQREAVEADEFLRPRIIGIPDASLTMNSTLAPREYHESPSQPPEEPAADSPPGYEALHRQMVGSLTA